MKIQKEYEGVLNLAIDWKLNLVLATYTVEYDSEQDSVRVVQATDVLSGEDISDIARKSACKLQAERRELRKEYVEQATSSCKNRQVA